MFLLTYL
jgi:ankyrin repeat protein